MARTKKAIRAPIDDPTPRRLEYLGTGEGGPDIAMKVEGRARRLVPGEILRVPHYTAGHLLRTPYFREVNDDGDI